MPQRDCITFCDPASPCAFPDYISSGCCIPDDGRRSLRDSSSSNTTQVVGNINNISELAGRGGPRCKYEEEGGGMFYMPGGACCLGGNGASIAYGPCQWKSVASTQRPARNYFLTVGLGMISAESLSPASATLLTLLTIPYHASANKWTYLCWGNTAGGTCKVDASSPWCFTYCKPNNGRVYAGYPEDSCCLSDQKTSQPREIRNGTLATCEIEAEASQTGESADSNLVPKAASIYDEPFYLPFGLCRTIGSDQQITYGTCTNSPERSATSVYRPMMSYTLTAGVVLAALMAGDYYCLPALRSLTDCGY